jgi:putative addiction module component (TIGR02574 family)
MKQITVSDIAEMPVKERIILVEDIWDSIAELPETVEIPDWHKAELDRRLEAYHKNPKAGSPWSDVKNRIIGKS